MLRSQKGQQHRTQLLRRPRLLLRPKLSIDALLGALQDHAVCALSEDGNICEWPEGAARLSGYSADEVMGRHISLVYRPEDRNAGMADLAIEIATTTGQHREQGWRLRKDGSEYWAAGRLHALRDDFGSLTGFVAVTTDLSYEKEREEQLLRSRRVAEESAQAKSEFLASMSHELRTPLNAISGFAQLLQLAGQEQLTDRQNSYVDMILESSTFLTRLISDVLDLASIEAGGVKTVSELVNLSQVIDSAVKLLIGNARASNIDLDATGTPGDLYVRGDSGRVLQVLTNLISNSIKYSGKSGRISVECTARDDGKTIVKVVDAGAGIAAERLGELFTPFNRLGREGSSIQGTGIGLATCRKLVGLMNGEIGAESTEGSGSTFWFTLPSAAQPAALMKAQDETRIHADTGEKHVVLCIEDNWANAKVLRGALGSVGSLTVEMAETGADGLAKAMSVGADLIIIDLHLPDISGFDVLRALKANIATAKIPTFALTADALPRTRERARQAGFDLFLTKPCRVAELLNAVAETLN
jgi:PAS domain S-box-containing protein